MSKGLVFSPSTPAIEFKDGSRDALIVPSGKLINNLPTPKVLTDYNVVFPDFTKDTTYKHIWDSHSNVGPGTWDLNEACSVGISIPPQEYNNIVDLETAPDGANLFEFLIRLTRTVNPSHNWISSPISKMVVEDKWIPCTGSMILEAHVGMTRSLSFYIDEDPLSSHFGKLVRHIQQSVATAPGGYGTMGAGENVQVAASGDSNGGEFVYGTSAGVPVYYPSGSPSVKSRYELYDPFVPVAPINPQLLRKGGAQQCTISDPTNYSSTWQVDLIGRYGRQA